MRRVVVTEGSVPFFPRFDFHETDQRMATLAFHVLREELCAYVYMQLLFVSSPSLSRHALPGPKHVNFPLFSAVASPGFTKSVLGLAVTVTVTMPRGVGIHAVVETVRHELFVTHHHVGNFTSARCAGGAVFTKGTGKVFHEYAAACSANVDSAMTGIQ